MPFIERERGDVKLNVLLEFLFVGVLILLFVLKGCDSLRSEVTQAGSNRAGRVHNQFSRSHRFISILFLFHVLHLLLISYFNVIIIHKS